MSRLDDIKKRLKNNGTEEQGTGGESRLEKIKKQVNSDKTSLTSVPTELNDLINEYTTFINDAKTSSEKLGFGTATDLAVGFNDRYYAFTEKIKEAKTKYNLNRTGSLTDEETELNIYLNKLSRSAGEALGVFWNAHDYYKQWKTEDDYNKAVKEAEEYEKKKNLDLDAYQKETERLRAEYEKADPSGWLSYGVDDNEYDKMKDEIAQREVYYNQAKRIQDGVALSGVADPNSKHYDPEFNNYTGYKSTESDGWWDKLTSQYGLGYDDLTYEYINGAENGIRSNIVAEAVAWSADSEKWKVYDHMTKDEIAIYNYYYAKNGKEKAEEYLESIRESLNAREATKMFGNLEDNTFAEMLFGIVAGLDQFESGVKNLFSDKDYYVPSSTQIASGMVREDLEDSGFKIFGNSLGQIGYDAITTTSNMLPSILVGTATGGWGTAISMGASAAGNAKAEMINLGYSKAEANTYGLMVGASEALLEKFIGGITGVSDGGIFSKLGAKALGKIDNAMARVAITLGGKMADEALEEGLQTILEPWFESIVTGADFDAPDIDEVLYSGLLGALTAGVFDIGGTVVGQGAIAENNAIRKQGKELMAQGIDINKLAELGKDTSFVSADSVAYRLAGKVNEKTGAYTIARLFNEMNAQLTTQNQADIIRSLEGKGVTPKHAETIATALANVVAGVEITKKQQKAIESNPVVAKTMQDVILNENSTVRQRMTKFNESVFPKPAETAPVTSQETTEQAQKVAPVENSTIVENAENKPENVSDDGKTKQISTGEEISIKRIASTKNGLSVELDNGSVIKASDISYATEGEAVMFDMLSRMETSPEVANEIFNSFKPKDMKQALSYFVNIPLAYNYGKIGYKQGLNNVKMSKEESYRAYNQGRKYAEAKAVADTKTPSKADTKTDAKTEKDGIIYENGFTYDESKANEMQKVSMAHIEVIKQMTNLEVHVFESVIKDGKRVAFIDGKWRTAPNGFFRNGNQIYIDINAGNKGEGAMLSTMGHEVAHYIRRWNAKGFKELADFLFKHYGHNGVSVDALIETQKDKIIKRYKYEGKALPSEAKLYDMAYEEVVADAMSDMLADPKAYEKLAELKSQNRTLWQKIGEAIKNVLDKFKKALGIYKDAPTTEEAYKVRDFAPEVYEKLQDLYLKAFVEADANYEATIGSRSLEDYSEAVNENGETLFQYRAMEADEDTYKDMLRKWGKMTEVQIDNLFETIDNAMVLIKANLEALDYAWEQDIDDRAFSPVKPNSDKLYQVSLDFSTLCRKRILQQTIQVQLQEALNKTLSKEEGIAIRDALISIQEEGRQIEVACALCYVESARMKSPEQIKRFIENREAVIKEFFAGKSGGNIKGKIKQAETDAREKMHKENPNGILGKDGKTMLDPRTASLKVLPKKYADQIRDAKKEAKKSYVPTAEEQSLIDMANKMTVSDFTSPEGLENLAKNYPKLFDAYTSYVRNATKSKGIENDVWWRAGDSMQIGDVLIANMNKENGLRSQSWSDFQVIHILDYIASTIELATRNTKEQAYSKVPDYVELMGNTGVMINMSLIPTAMFNGKLDYDSVEGIEYKRALELREKYHKTAGTICIGVKNQQIKMLLADITIDYVIPYHKSGMSAAVRKLMRIPTWDDYEAYQGESNLSKAEAEKQAKKYGVKLLDASDPNYQKGTTFSEWFDLREAQQITKMENANPTDKAKQKKYGVMYGGYMAMQNAANNYLKLCAERGLAPKFSHEKADFSAEENYWKLLIDRKMVDNVTGEIIEQQTIKPVFDGGEVMRILNDEVERYPKVKADQDYAIRKVTEKMLSGEVKGGMSAKAIADVMKKPVDNVTNVNILASAEDMKLSDRDTLPDFDDVDAWFESLPVEALMWLMGNTDIVETIESLPTKRERRDAYINKLYEQGKLNDLVTKLVKSKPQMAEYFANTQMNNKYNPLFPSKSDEFVVMFHGTPSDFNVFDTNKVGKHGTAMGSGIYFTSSLSYAEGYKEDGGRVIATLLKIEKPLSRNKLTITKDQFKTFVKQVVDSTGEDFLSNYGDVNSIGYDRLLNKVTNELFEHNSNDADLIEDVYVTSRMDFDEFHNGLTETLGYDGVIAWNKAEGTQAIVFKSNQAKEIFNFNPTSDPDIRYSERDTLGNELSTDQQEFFKDSKVRDNKGNLKVVYHGTKANFNVFAKGDIGFHFGTKGAARGRVGAGKNVTIKEVYLNITNPISINKDLGSWNADTLAVELFNMKLLTKAEAESVLFTDDKLYRRSTDSANKKLREMLLQKGYDGIEYRNTFESKKDSTSYIAFGSSQIKEITNQSPAPSADIRYSVRDIVGASGTNYGKGVYLDSTLLTNLTEDERVEMVKEYLKEIGGSVFTAYDDKGNPVDVHIVKSSKKFKNAKGKKVLVNQHLTNYVLDPVKQEAIALIDELILTARQGGTETAIHPHGWLDNNGKNDWDVWRTYIQDKEKTVWEAKLNIANSVNGEKILYEVYPIKKVEGVEKIDTTSTEHSISQVPNYVNSEFSDKDYLDAVNSGDMETAQKMVDEAAKKAGYNSPKLYHGTPLKMMSASKWKLTESEYAELNEKYDDKLFPFVVFSSEKSRSGLTYTATSKKAAETFAYPRPGTVFALYARFENPLVVNEHVYESTPYYYEVPTPSVMRKAGINKAKLSTEEIAHWAKDNGYDGVIVEGVREGGGDFTDDYITFSSSQLKSADPVTYDADGNVIPLSERFNSENNDIRYQDRDTELVSNRTLLANALESVAQNEIEQNKLKQYKSKIALIESEQAKLEKVKAEANKLRFTKGRTQSETKRMRELDAEATMIANRISTYDRQLLNLESTTALKNVLEREKKLAYKKAEQKGKEALERQRERAAQTVREVITRNQESRKKAMEGRHKTEMRHKIKKVVSDLNKLLLHGTKERNIKPGLQQAVAMALEAINMDTVSADARIAKLKDDLLKAKTPEKIAEVQHKIDHIQNMGDRMSDKLEALGRAYREIKNSTGNEYSSQFKEEATLIEGKIESVLGKVGNTPLRDMSLSQLEAVYDLYTMVLTTVRNANGVWRQGKLEDLQQNASAVMAEVDELPKIKSEGSKFRQIVRAFKWNNMTPYYAFDRIGSNTFMKFFKDFIEAQNTYGRDIAEVKEFAQSTRKKYNYSKWDLDKVYDFKLKDGRTFSTTLKHMLSIYAYSKREQALDHMSVGGFFHNDKATFRKKGGIIEMVRTDDVGYKVDFETLEEIKSALGKEKMSYVDEMQEYLTKMGEKGNEVTRVMWGIDIFKEKVYFPLKSKNDFIKSSTETAQAVSLKNDGMTKETVPGASNPIVLEAFDDVWARHTERMSQYHAFVLPIDNLNKIHQYGTWAGTDSMAVSTLLAGRFGNAVNEYISQFIKDMNGNVVSQGVTNPFAGFFSKFKKTAVGMSLSTVVQQPTAIVRAMSLVDARYFVGKPNLTGLSKKWEELKTYAPIAIIKDIGGFDAGSGVQVTNWINSDALTGVDKVMNVIDDVSMKGAELADKLGWTTIWEAVKRETKATTNLAVGSEAFLKKAGERFTEVIVQTQVYDSTLSRSGFMRSKNDGVKMLTSFMGEPTLSVNMLYNSVVNVMRGGSKLKAAKTIGCVYVSSILASAFASAIYALNDDDEDESYMEKYMQAFGGEFISDIVLMPVTSLPAVKDIISIFQGWDVERTDVAIFKDIKDAFDGLFSDTKSPYRKIEGFAGAIGAAFGLPVKNLLKTGRQIYNSVNDIFVDKITGGNLGDAFLEGITNEKKSKTKKLYDAIVSGDTARLEVLREDYEDEDAYISAIRKALRENDPRIQEAAQALFEGDVAEYGRIIDEIADEGNFEALDIKSAIESELNKIEQENSTEEDTPTEDKAESIYEAEHYYMALIKGDTYTANKVKEDIINTEVANGKSREEAEKSFYSSFNAKVRDGYADGTINRTKAMEMLISHGGMESNDAYWTMDKYDYYKQNGSYDGYSKYGDFHNAVRTGVSLKSVIQEYISHGVEAKTLASQITSYFKPLYINMTNSERAGIKGYLLNAYAQLGYNRYEKSKDIDNWLK